MKADIEKSQQPSIHLLSSLDARHLPVAANDMLDRIGLLKQSKTRRGITLCNLLRAGYFPHAYQPGGKGTEWIIPRSKR